MHDVVIDDPCVIFPLRREASAFYREFRAQQRFSGARCPAHFRGPEWLTILTLECGVGSAALETTLAWLLAKPIFGNVPYRPKVVILAGFAGALRAAQAVGDIILATEIVGTEGERWPTTWPGALPEGEWRPPLHRGRVVSANRLIGAPEEKRRLGVEHDALAVDMESAALARLCQRHDVPFGCVRAISDAVDEPLSPELLALLSRGRVSIPRLLLALARRPTLTAELWRLARNTRHAAAQLGKAVGELLTLTMEGGKGL